MREYEETKETQVVTTKKLVEILCDICGKDVDDHDECYNECTIKHEYMGSDYFGENHYSGEFEIDICSECFKTKIVPFIQSLGVDKDYKTNEF